MRSCERPRKRSASEALPSSVSNRYCLSIRTHGSSCRRRASSSLCRVSSFSALSSSSRAASHCSRVPVLCLVIALLPRLVFDERPQPFGRVVPLRRDLVEIPLCSLQAFAVQVPHPRSEEHTSELQSQSNLVCRLLLEKKNQAHREVPPAQSRAQRAEHVGLDAGTARHQPLYLSVPDQLAHDVGCEPEEAHTAGHDRLR